MLSGEVDREREAKSQGDFTLTGGGFCLIAPGTLEWKFCLGVCLSLWQGSWAFTLFLHWPWAGAAQGEGKPVGQVAPVAPGQPPVRVTGAQKLRSATRSCNRIQRDLSTHNVCLTKAQRFHYPLSSWFCFCFFTRPLSSSTISLADVSSIIKSANSFA